MRSWKKDPGLHFDAIADGWLVPKQPAQSGWEQCRQSNRLFVTLIRKRSMILNDTSNKILASAPLKSSTSAL
jgi:hypothetical protein